MGNLPKYTIDQRNKIFYLHYSGEITFYTVRLCESLVRKLGFETETWRFVAVNRQEKIAGILDEAANE